MEEDTQHPLACVCPFTNTHTHEERGGERKEGRREGEGGKGEIETEGRKETKRTRQTQSRHRQEPGRCTHSTRCSCESRVSPSPLSIPQSTDQIYPPVLFREPELPKRSGGSAGRRGRSLPLVVVGLLIESPAYMDK